MNHHAPLQQLAPGAHGAQEEELIQRAGGLHEPEAFPLLVRVRHEEGPQVQPDLEEEPGVCFVIITWVCVYIDDPIVVTNTEFVIRCLYIYQFIDPFVHNQ